MNRLPVRERATASPRYCGEVAWRPGIIGGTYLMRYGEGGKAHPMDASILRACLRNTGGPLAAAHMMAARHWAGEWIPVLIDEETWREAQSK